MEDLQREQDDSVYHRTTTPTTRNFRVKLEDGTVETFKVDTRVGLDRLPRVLEAAVRARTRQKQGKPDKGVEPPSMGPKSVTSFLTNTARGGVNIAAGLGREFVGGLKFLNQQPLEALKLMPEMVNAPMRKLDEAEGKINKAVAQGDVVGGLKEAIEATPIIGPKAQAFGEGVAEGRGGEALGELATGTILDFLATKGSSAALKAASRPGRTAMANNLTQRAAANREVAPINTGDVISASRSSPIGKANILRKGYSKAAAPVQEYLADKIRPKTRPAPIEPGEIEIAARHNAPDTTHSARRTPTQRTADTRGAGQGISMVERRQSIIEQLSADRAAAGKKPLTGGALEAKIRSILGAIEKRDK